VVQNNRIWSDGLGGQNSLNASAWGDGLHEVQIQLMLGAMDGSLLEFEDFFGKVACTFFNLSCWLNLHICLKARVHNESTKCCTWWGKKSSACLEPDSTVEHCQKLSSLAIKYEHSSAGHCK